MANVCGPSGGRFALRAVSSSALALLLSLTGSYAVNQCPCTAGNQCDNTVSYGNGNCVSCTAGAYCVGGIRNAPCLAGFYGSTTGQSVPTCSGPCTLGYFCEPGATSPTATTSCSQGYFCASGTTAPTPCPPGFYNDLVGQSSSAACRPCTGVCGEAENTILRNVAPACSSGEFCLPGTVEANDCPDLYRCV